VIGRYGGEEIVVLLENVSPDRGFDAAEKLREMIENTPVSHQRSTINITVSIGVAYSPSGAVHSLEDMLAQADLALYKAKNNGRNRMWPSQEDEKGYG